MKRIVVMGAGVGGLGTALGLARRGHTVTVVDRDPGPEAETCLGSFSHWNRKRVPQFRQPHAFHQLTRNLLVEHAPDVLEALLAGGATEANVFHTMVPPELREPDDDQFTGLSVRRPPFEFALRRAVEAEANVELRPSTTVEALELSTNGERRVAGVRLEGGERLDADVVVDAAGRRSPTERWLADLGVELPRSEQSCNMTYYTRYFEQAPDSELDRNLLMAGPQGDHGNCLGAALFSGDNRSYAIFFGAAPWDQDLKVLRQEQPFMALARALPVTAAWAGAGEPVTPVMVMSGHQNLYRHWDRARGVPVGLVPVGDAVCTTNPTFGWGASQALSMAFAAVEAIDSCGDDAPLPRYLDAISDRAHAYYRTSAAEDRMRTYRWKGEPVPEDDALWSERNDLLMWGLLPAMRRDMYVLRAMMRRIGMIDHPDAIWEDERALSIARDVAAYRKAKQKDRAQWSRDQILEALAS